MQQWMDTLANLRQSESLNCLDPAVARSISSVLVTCFGIAKRRVKEALLVLQGVVQQMSKPVCVNQCYTLRNQDA